jgi:hypothetical protein
MKRCLNAIAVAVLLLGMPLQSALAQPFSNTTEYQAVESVWNWFIDYMAGTTAKKPLHLDYFLKRETRHYAEKRGYLWPENQEAVENRLDELRTSLRNGQNPELARRCYYPYRGLTPFTAKEFRYYYDVIAHAIHVTGEQAADETSAEQLIAELQFDSYFLDYKAHGEIVLNNTESPIYLVLFGKEDGTAAAYEALRDLCTPTNKRCGEERGLAGEPQDLRGSVPQRL